jgi:ATP-dependent RNA helicase DDX49/DBP8
MSLFAKKKSHKRPRSSEAAGSTSEAAAAAARPQKERKSEAAAASAAVEDVKIEGDASGFDTDATFRSLGLCDWLQGTCSAMSFKRPTPVQKHCIPAIMAGKVSDLFLISSLSSFTLLIIVECMSSTRCI